MQREKRYYCIVLLHGLEEGEWLCSYSTASQLSIRSSVRHVSNEKAPFQLLNLNAPLNMTAIAVITVVMVGVITTSSISQQQSACYVLGLLLNSLLYYLIESSRNPLPLVLLPDALFRCGHWCSERGETLLKGHKVTKCQAGDSLPVVVFSTRPALDAFEKSHWHAILPRGWAGSCCFCVASLPPGLQSLTSVLIIWHKSAPQLHECHSHEHL